MKSLNILKKIVNLRAEKSYLYLDYVIKLNISFCLLSNIIKMHFINLNLK